MVPLLVVALASFSVLSSTMARFTSEYSGQDTALIAKWNFRAGNSAENLQNVGFTFDVFNDQELAPQDSGSNSFLISGGESDVAIDYEVYMNVNALLADINGVVGGTDYPPLIFRVSSMEATVAAPYNNWFSLKDITKDAEGYFLVGSGQIAAGSANLITITTYWWWNTSCYVGTANLDESPTGNYYVLAQNVYDSLVDTYNDRVSEANAFFTQHVRTVSSVDGVEVVTYDCPDGSNCPITLGAAGGDIDGAHIAAHEELLDSVTAARTAINNSLKVQYDNYDTKAVAKLKSLESTAPEGIVIKVIGKQKTPAQ
jgi:hypothetical protein